MPSGKKLPEGTYKHTYDVFISNNKDHEKTVQQLGISLANLNRRLWKYRKENNIDASSEEIKKISSQPEMVIPDLGEEDMPVGDLVNRLTKDFQRKQNYREQKRWIPIQVTTDKPIGLAWMGDPHIDDPYCDWVTLRRDLNIIKNTSGMRGCSLGDQTNNWVGRLSRLYENHTVTKQQSWKLVEWLIKEMDPFLLIAGNHDLWSGNSDPVQWMKRPHTLYEQWTARIELQFPNGKKIRIIVSHDFAGHSMWNNLHGQMKAAKFLSSAHLYIAGHKHNWALSQIELPENDMCCWLGRARGYKFYDEFATKLGYEEQRYGHSICTIINPKANNKTDLMLCFANLEEGAEYLKWKRKQIK
jgi:hypothetical protein